MEEGRLRPLKASRGGPALSYLFFADDLLFFSEADRDQLHCIKQGIEQFCKASWQKVNYSKSSMICSNNITTVEAKELSDSIGVSLKHNPGEVLGTSCVE